MEKDDEVKGEGNSYTTSFRQLDPRLGRWLTIDPLAKEFPWQTPYCSMDNNPINLIDRTGTKGESTHIDEKGNVIAVFDDGDNSVYKHIQNADGGTPTEYMIKRRIEKWGTAAHGTKIGTTKYWNEFISPETGKAEGVIHEGESWDALISNLHKESMKYNLYQIAQASRDHRPLDIKTNPKIAPDGTMTGRLLNGQYASVRSAGNYLAGKNGRHATLLGHHVTKTQYMMIAGSLDKGFYSNELAALIGLGTVTPEKWPYPAPYYGEDKYSGRRILEGWYSK